MYKVIVLLLFFISRSSLQAAVIGSDSAPSLITTQQLLQNGDRVAGFAWLKAGFDLQGLNTTSTFDSFFPVSGQVALNAGNLILNRDLHLANYSDFYTIGNINGYFHTLELAPSTTCFPSIVSLVSTPSVTTQTTTSVGNQVTVVAWSYDSKYLTVGTANKFGSELYLYSYNGISLTLLDSVSIGNHMLDIDWHPSKFIFTIGCASSPQIRVYSVNPATPNLSTVISTFALTTGTPWATALNYHPSGDYIAVGTQDTAQQIIVFPVNANGTLDTVGRVSTSFGNPLTINSEALNFSPTGDFFAVGVTNSGGTFDELRVYRLNTSPLSFTLNASELIGDIPCVDWLKTSTYVLFTGLNVSPRLRAYAHNATAGALSLIASTATNLPVLIRCISADPASSAVAITTNLDGSNPEFRIYTYDPVSTPSFSLVSSVQSTANVDSLYWAANSNYIAFGDATGLVTVLNRNSIAFLNQCFTFSNVQMYLNSNVCIQNACITFAGQSSINGREHTLTLAPTATLAIDTNSQLMLENITVMGVGDRNFNPIDNSGSLFFREVTWDLSNDYIFDKGSFFVQNWLNVQGALGASFQYLTTQTSIILPHSQLLFDYGTTFSYAPLSAANNLLRLVDSTSIFMLSSALLHTSTGGINFTKGLCKVDGKSSMSNRGATKNQGIIFGDNVSAINNCNMEIMPAAQLDLLTGFIVHRNV